MNAINEIVKKYNENNNNVNVDGEILDGNTDFVNLVLSQLEDDVLNELSEVEDEHWDELKAKLESYEGVNCSDERDTGLVLDEIRSGALDYCRWAGDLLHYLEDFDEYDELLLEFYVNPKANKDKLIKFILERLYWYKKYENRFFTVEITKSFKKGIGNIGDKAIRMDFEMHYPNDGKAEPKYRTNRISWSNNSFGLGDLVSSFNGNMIINAYYDKCTEDIETTLDLGQVLAFCLATDEESFAKKLELDSDIWIEKVEVVDKDTIKVYICNIADCVEIKRVYDNDYKFAMQVYWYQTERTMIED